MVVFAPTHPAVSTCNIQRPFSVPGVTDLDEAIDGNRLSQSVTTTRQIGAQMLQIEINRGAPSENLNP